MLDTSRILQKGPEYLRKQIEREREVTGRSAAERLAATKPEYIRNQQSLPSENVSNLGSPDHSEPVISSSGDVSGENLNVVKRNSSKKRPDSLLLYRLKGDLLRGSPARTGKRRAYLDSHKDQTNLQEFEESDSDGLRLTKEATGSQATQENAARKPAVPSDQEDVARKSAIMITVDQKSAARKPRTGFTRDKEDAASKPMTINQEGVAKISRTVVKNTLEDASRKQTTFSVARKQTSAEGSYLQDDAGEPAMAARSERSSRSNRVSRSHSDVSSRYSRNFANFDTFFTYCGLDDDIIELVGRANFCLYSEVEEEELISSSKVRSVSVATSDDGFSQASSNHSDGLHEDELPDKTSGKGPSVIERNARVIKWLYSCRNAAQSGKTLRDLH